MGNGILVVCEHEDGTPKKTAYELLSKARQLTAESGGDVTAVVIGAGGDLGLGEYGAKTVYTADGADFSSGASGPWIRALQAAVEAASPAVVLGAASPKTREAFPRLAARIGAGMATDCTDLFVSAGAGVGRRPMLVISPSQDLQ